MRTTTCRSLSALHAFQRSCELSPHDTSSDSFTSNLCRTAWWVQSPWQIAPPLLSCSFPARANAHQSIFLPCLSAVRCDPCPMPLTVSFSGEFPSRFLGGYYIQPIVKSIPLHSTGRVDYTIGHWIIHEKSYTWCHAPWGASQQC